jgi:hypothetical protein
MMFGVTVVEAPTYSANLSNNPSPSFLCETENKTFPSLYFLATAVKASMAEAAASVLSWNKKMVGFDY